MIQTQNLQERYLADIQKTLASVPRFIPTCYLYLDGGSKLFARVCGEAAYTVYAEETRLIAELSKLSPLASLKHANIIEMGGGDPTKLNPLLASLFRVPHPVYTCIDLSESMIRASMRGVSKMFPQAAFMGIVADFASGVLALKALDNLPRVFLLLGNTFSNLTPQEVALLMDAFRLSMCDADILVLGVVVGSHLSDDSIYNRSINFRLLIEHALHTLSVNAGAEIGPDAFVVEFERRPDIRAYCSHLVSQYRQKIVLPKVDLEIVLQENEKITVGMTYLRTKEEIEALFASNRFVTVEHISARGTGSQLFILRKVE